MSSFNKAAFIDFILDNGVVGFFERPVTLKSGRTSNWYVNWRTVSGDAFLIDMLSDFLISFTEDLGFEPDSFYGVPEGASKIGVLSTLKRAKARPDFSPGRYALPMGRGKPKEHGDPKDRYFLTPPEGNIIVVEDVTTTGGSLISALESLKYLDAKVLAAVGLTSRMELRDDGTSVKDALAEMGVEYHALSCAEEFLPAAFKKFSPGEAMGRAIEKEFERYGENPLKLL
ncbi:MAG: hypothetical protein WC683_08765 [bacterium]